MNLSEYIDGLRSLFQSFGYISRHSLWKYCIIPALISLAAMYFIYGFFHEQTDYISDWLVKKYPLEVGSGIVATIGSAIAKAVSFLASLLMFKYFVLIISSPFMSTLSERVEEIELGGVATRSTPTSMIRDFIRGIRISIGNLARELLYTGLVLLICTLPIIGFASFILTFLVQAYYAGFGAIDFMLERHMTINESRKFVKEHKSYATGIGTGFLLLTLTGIGVLVAAPLATVASTRRLSREI